MNRCILAGVILFVMVSNVGAVEQGQREGQGVMRSDLHEIELADGSVLGFFARVFYPKERDTTGVRVTLRSQKGTLLWVTEFATVDYEPGNTGYLGLVKATENHVFLFATWNAQFCTFDKITGRVLKEGEGDDILKQYDSLLPMKLKLIPGPSTGVDGSR